MKTILYTLLLISSYWKFKGQELVTKFPKIKTVEYSSNKQEQFVKYSQYQMKFELEPNKSNGLLKIKNANVHIENYLKCLEDAKSSNSKVIIFPELALEVSDVLRQDLLNKLKDFCLKNDAIIIAGSYFDKERHSKLVVIMPNGIYESYKIRPSKFEAVIDEGKGMTEGDTLYFFKTKYGNFLPITCVDLISDDVQYLARNLSNQNLLEVLVNITYNPASWEFMREASAIVVRHPLFVSITNVATPSSEKVDQPSNSNCFDNGGIYGNSSLFCSISKELKNTFLDKVSDCFKNSNYTSLHPAYSTLIRQINPELQGRLSYDLNFRLIRQPESTNAPDQGYPTVKNVVFVKLDLK